MNAANTKELPQNRNNYCWSPLRYSIYGRVEKEQKERVKFAFVCASKARVWNRQRIEKDNNSEAAHSLKPKRRKRRGPVAPPEKRGLCARSRNYSYFHGDLWAAR